MADVYMIVTVLGSARPSVTMAWDWYEANEVFASRINEYSSFRTELFKAMGEGFRSTERLSSHIPQEQ